MKIWIHAATEQKQVKGSSKFPGSGKDREDSMRNQWYIPEYYPDIDEDRIADFHRIDWKDVVAEDSEEFLKDEVTFPDLSAIKSIRYFEGPEQDWADEFNYEGGYVVDYNDGSKRYFAWTNGGAPLEELDSDQIGEIRYFQAKRDSDFAFETGDSRSRLD